MSGGAPAEGEGLALDLHAHTRFFHSDPGQPTRYDRAGARMLAAFARWYDLDGVALTNHDYYRSFGSVPGLSFLPGIEISTTDGHLLVVGPDPPTHTDPGALTPVEAVDLAHERGCAAILPHPFRRGSVLESDAPFDAVEINGKHPRVGERVRDLAAERDLPVVAGSDAHLPFEVGRAYTTVDVDEVTPGAVVDAIREGRVAPRIVPRSSSQVMELVYQVVHRYRRLDWTFP
jgi:predicted metal-dependent phosphoesterase TrpH